jgi:hypothetical protein
MTDERIDQLDIQLGIRHPQVAADIARGLVARIRSDAAEIERLRDALDEINRHCGDNGETNGDRDRRWAAEVARKALSAGERDAGLPTADDVRGILRADTTSE